MSERPDDFDNDSDNMMDTDSEDNDSIDNTDTDDSNAAVPSMLDNNEQPRRRRNRRRQSSSDIDEEDDDDIDDDDDDDSTMAGVEELANRINALAAEQQTMIQANRELNELILITRDRLGQNEQVDNNMNGNSNSNSHNQNGANNNNNNDQNNFLNLAHMAAAVEAQLQQQRQFDNGNYPQVPQHVKSVNDIVSEFTGLWRELVLIDKRIASLRECYSEQINPNANTNIGSDNTGPVGTNDSIEQTATTTIPSSNIIGNRNISNDNANINNNNNNGNNSTTQARPRTNAVSPEDVVSIPPETMARLVTILRATMPSLQDPARVIEQLQYPEFLQQLTAIGQARNNNQGNGNNNQRFNNNGSSNNNNNNNNNNRSEDGDSDVEGNNDNGSNDADDERDNNTNNESQ